MTNLPLLKFPGFLTQEEYDECGKILKDSKDWNFEGTSLGTPGKSFWNKRLDDHDIFAKQILEKIKKRTGDNFILKRVYANGQDLGQDGEFHQDDTDPNAWTFLLYMNTIEDGGETEFQVGGPETIMKQKATLNTGLLFKSDILHRGLAPKSGDERRITVAWKLYLMQKFTFFTEPVPHCVVHDYYTQQELDLLWTELDFLKGKLLPPEQTGTAVGQNGKPKKRNRGAFIDDLYTKRELSNILQLNRKIGNVEIIQKILGQHWFYNYLKPSDRLKDRTLVSYYEDGDYYEPHTDSATVTVISYHWKEPKPFEGGDLYFGDYKVPLENNCLLIFPSCTEHEVKPVKGSGRYAVTQFITNT